MPHGSLQTWLDRALPFPDGWLASIAHQILSALALLHSHQRVHRDVKVSAARPRNRAPSR